MSEGDGRGFSVGDGMILVAASALAIVGFRLTSGHLRWDLADPNFWVIGGFGAPDWGTLALALAVIVIRLRRPRPALDRLWRQPGWLACFGVVATLGLETLEMFAIYLVEQVAMGGSTGLDPSTIFLEVLPLHAPDDISRAVIVIWGILALSGSWTAERSLVDRLGRVVGWYWVVRALASPLLMIVM